MGLNFLFLHLHLFLFLIKTCSSYSCIENGRSEFWECIENETGNLNVTYDCSWNGSRNTSIWLWSDKYPNKTDTLIIQNCRELILYTGHPFSWNDINYIKYQLKLNFQFLIIKNIENLLIYPDKPSDWRNFVPYDPRGCCTYYSSRRQYYNRYYPCLLGSVVFEKIEKLLFDHNFLPDCNETDIKFDSISDFKIVNPAIGLNVGNFDLLNSKLSNEKIVLNIVKGTDVTISNNIFGHLNKKNQLSIKAEKIIIKDNKIALLKDDSLSITCDEIQITNNTFLHIDKNAFRLVTGTNSESGDNILRFYNFSNNKIYSLSPGALTVTPQNITQKNIFDSWIISNNQIICNCANIYWFDSLVKQTNDLNNAFQHNFYYKWFEKKNRNECLNIQNCSINQVVNNYIELCSENYNCTKRVQNISVLMSSINYNYEMNENISSLLGNLTFKIENKILKNNNGKNDEIFRNYSIYFINNFRNEQKEISNLPFLNIIENCLFVVVLLVVMLSVFAVMKCLNALALKCRDIKLKSAIAITDPSLSLTELVANI